MLLAESREQQFGVLWILNGGPLIFPKRHLRIQKRLYVSALEKEVSAWVLPRSVDLFGELIVSCPDTFGVSVLTTNFDPRIEISISKHGGRFYRTVLHADGNLEQTVGQGTHIVHLHGYWYGHDSLHTHQQLLQERPQLKRSLERVIENSVLVVMGYSGWDDVITHALADILSDSASNPEIMLDIP